MSASHKPTLHLSEFTGSVYLGCQSKSNPSILVGEKTNVTGLFIEIMLAKFGPAEPETTASTDLISRDPNAPKYRVTIERIEA
jgi:hypothetical protein